MAVAQTTTYRGREYQRVVHEDVPVLLDYNQEVLRHLQELLRLCAIEQSFATAYSSEENGIVELLIYRL